MVRPQKFFSLFFLSYNFNHLVHPFSNFSSATSLFDTPSLLSLAIDSCWYGSDYVTYVIPDNEWNVIRVGQLTFVTTTTILERSKYFSVPTTVHSDSCWFSSERSNCRRAIRFGVFKSAIKQFLLV